MKLFVSYRRDDTGGRAGRLCDALVARFGAGNVFQDVNAVAPGHDFRAQVEAAIATSDAVLIVIGADWLRVVDEHGRRRIDRDDDVVRSEVSAALGSGIPVVPVLVDGAALPSHDELPPEISGMLGRHAVTIRDTSWHQDVDDLSRRLKGGERVAAPARRWPIVVGSGVLVVLAGLLAAAALRNGPDESSTSDLPPCERPDERWTQVELAVDPTDDIINEDGHEVMFEVLRAAVLADTAGSARVVVQVKATNGNEPRDDDMDIYFFGSGDIDSLLVGGVQFNADCFGPVDGDEQSLEPDESAIAWTGFTTTGVRTGAPLRIELDSDGIVDLGTSP